MSDIETVEPALDFEADLETIKAASATAAAIVQAAKENAAAVEAAQRQAATALAGAPSGRV